MGMTGLVWLGLVWYFPKPNQWFSGPGKNQTKPAKFWLEKKQTKSNRQIFGSRKKQTKPNLQIFGSGKNQTKPNQEQISRADLWFKVVFDIFQTKVKIFGKGGLLPIKRSNREFCNLDFFDKVGMHNCSSW